MSDQATRHDQWTFKVMNDPRTKRFHATRAARRGFVSAHIAATAAGVAGIVMTHAAGALWWLALTAAALLAWMPLTGMLNSATYGLFELRKHMLDERQKTERAYVRSLSYRATTLIMTAALAVCLTLTTAGGFTLKELAEPIAVTALALLVAHLLMPLWIATLREPGELE